MMSVSNICRVATAAPSPAITSGVVALATVLLTLGDLLPGASVEVLAHVHVLRLEPLASCSDQAGREDTRMVSPQQLAAQLRDPLSGIVSRYS